MLMAQPALFAQMAQMIGRGNVRMDWQRGRGILIKSAIGAGIALVSLGVAGRVFLRIATKGLETHTDYPSLDFESAIARLAAIQTKEDDKVNPLCRTQALTHQTRTRQVFVLVHGITNCPEQFAEIGAILHKQGHNVLLPRMPHNGYADRMTDALKHLTAAELRDFTNTIVDIARGMGEQVTFLGLSAGGVMAAWVVQHRPDVDTVVLVAPSLTIGHLSVRMSVLVMALFLLLPNILTQKIMPFKDGPNYTYFGHSTRALAEVMRLGASVFLCARKKQAAVQSVLLITNASDPAVNNTITWLLVNLWRARGMRHLEEYAFDKKYKLVHDIIDPNQEKQQTALVYPILLDLITREEIAEAPDPSLQPG